MAKLRSEVVGIDALNTRDERKPCPHCHKVTWKRTGLGIVDKPMGRTVAEVVLCLDCAATWAVEMHKRAVQRGGKDRYAPPCSKKGCGKRSSVSVKIRTTAEPAYINFCHDHLETLSSVAALLHSKVRPMKGRRSSAQGGERK